MLKLGDKTISKLILGDKVFSTAYNGDKLVLKVNDNDKIPFNYSIVGSGITITESGNASGSFSISNYLSLDNMPSFTGDFEINYVATIPAASKFRSAGSFYNIAAPQSTTGSGASGFSIQLYGNRTSMRTDVYCYTSSATPVFTITDIPITYSTKYSWNFKRVNGVLTFTLTNLTTGAVVKSSSKSTTATINVNGDRLGWTPGGVIYGFVGTYQLNECYFKVL